MNRALSLAAFVVPFALLAATVQTDVQFWDIGEFQTVPYIFGIAHPTGFPVYVFLGWIITHAIPVGSVAMRISLLSALATASSAWLAFALTRRIAGSALFGLITSLLFVATPLAWLRGTRADVHPLALTFTAAAFYAAYCFRETGEVRHLYLAAIFDGLGLGTHPVAIWSLPAQTVLVGFRLHPLSFRQWATAILLVCLGLATYFYMPLRSAQLTAAGTDPTVGLGYDRGMPYWDYGHTADLRRFVVQVTGQQLVDCPRPQPLALYTGRACVTWKAGGQGLRAYIDFGHYPDYFFNALRVEKQNLGWLGLIVAAIGLCALWSRTDKVPAVAVTLLAAAGIPFAFGYLEETDKDRYLFQTLWSTAFCFGMGLAFVRSSLERRIRWATPLTAAFGTVIVVAVAYTTYVSDNLRAVNNDQGARAYVDRIRMNTPSDAIVVSAWLYSTPVAYGIFVDHTLGHRIIVTAEPLTQTAEMAAFSQTRCVVVALPPTSPPLAGDDLLVRRLGRGEPTLEAVRKRGYTDRCHP